MTRGGVGATCWLHTPETRVQVTPPQKAQRAVAGCRTLACLLSVALVLLTPSEARATDGGVLDPPRAVRLDNGSLLLNPQGSKLLDEELKRLQGVERVHNEESWFKVVAVGVGVGILLGVGVGFAAGYATRK